VTDPVAGVSQVANPHLMRAQALGLAGWRVGGGRHRERVLPTPPGRQRIDPWLVRKDGPQASLDTVAVVVAARAARAGCTQHDLAAPDQH
jgi:hypothetical protein